MFEQIEGETMAAETPETNSCSEGRRDGSRKDGDGENETMLQKSPEIQVSIN